MEVMDAMDESEWIHCTTSHLLFDSWVNWALTAARSLLRVLQPFALRARMNDAESEESAV